nr:unnamed protein product [Callosobruchus chinensis]
MSTQTESLYPGLFTRKPKLAVKSTQTAVKTVSFAVQTEHKYVSLSTQTDSDSVSKCIDNFIQNDPAASDEESISDILSEMKNIPRLLSPITDMFDSKMPDTKNTIDKKNNHFAKRNWRGAIHTSRSYPSKYLPWKRRMILKNVRLNITRDPVAKALQILKRAKINFTISNERILTHPRDYSRQQVLPQNQPVESKKIFVEKLSRCYSSCATGYTHMRLSKTGGCTELLGFFTEEKKSTTQTNVDIASRTTQKNSNLKERTDFVDETAKIVISKLKEEFNLIPKIKRMRKLSSSDSEMSEFENGGFSTERSAKKIKKFKSMKRRRYSQKEDTTSGFESSCTPLTQCSTMSSQQLDIKSTENQLQESPNNFSPNLQNITTPVAPLSDIIDNQLFESNISIDPSLVDSESQTINQYNVQPNPHINEELIDGHMQKISNGDIPEVNKQKCDLKLPQNKHEEGKISDTVAGIKKLKPRKKRKPMSKLKSKTLRQFKQKMLMFQTENPISASVGHKTNNANPTQNKFISEAKTEIFPDIKSQNGKTQDIKANKSNRSRRDMIGQDSTKSKIPSCDFNSRNQTINVDNFKFDDKSRTQEMQPDISVNKKHDKSTGNCSDNVDLPRKVHLKNKKSNTLRANRRRMCDTKFDTAKRKSNTSLQCNEPLKNGTEIDPVQSSNGQHVGPYLKFLNAIGKFEQERTMNIDDHKNEKSVDKCYNPDQSVRGVIQPDIDFSLKDSNANKTPDSGRRSSRRLMKSNITSGTTSVQTSSKESLTVTKNSTAISVEHCGTNSTEIDGQKANVDVYPDLNIKHTKIDSDIKSIVPTDLPQVSLCDVIDSPVSPESFSEPEDYDIKIIPLYPTETINNTENYINNENYVKEETKIPINENTTQNKCQVGKRSEPSVIRRSKRKEISVLQNIVIRPSNPTIVNKKEDEFDQSDIMSKIIDDMNKSKRLSVKNKDPNICNVSPTNHKLDDKEWRRMILDVAELIHCDEEMLNFDLRPFESRITPHIYLKTRSLLAKTTILIKKLKATNESENVRDELITEFKRFSPETVVNIILYGLTNDKDKTLNTYHPLLLLTKLQWLFLKLIIQLEEANMRNIFELYLQTAEPLLYRKCNLTTVVPLTRFYVAICKLHGNVNQVRKLCCEAFYYMADLAVILLHTVLISWIEIFPMQDNVKCFPIAEVMAQLIHLKNINKGDYKLQSLKALLNQYYGYPDERLDCDVFFKALVRKYLCNPVRILNFAIRLYCKYKNNCWLKQIINHVFKPLVYKIPVENEEFKATVIVLLANICEQLKIISTDKYIVELRAWFSSLSEGETPQLIQHSVEYALSKLNFTKTQQKKTKKATPKKQKKAIPKKKKNAKPKKKKSPNLSRHKTNP